MPDACISHPPPSVNTSIWFRPLMPLLFALIAGIFGAYHLPDYRITAWSGVIALSGVLILSIRQSKGARIIPLLLFFCLGYVGFVPWVTPNASGDSVRDYVDDGTYWQISGIIIDTPLPQGFRTVCILDHVCLSRLNDSAFPPITAKGKLRAIAYGTPGGLNAGDLLTFTSRIRPFTNFNNPGGFDYIRYMAFQQVWGNAYTSTAKISVRPPAGGIQKSLTGVRKKISESIRKSVSGDAGAVLHALVLGDRQQISKSLNEAIRRAGLSHLLAISGLHIGIVASFAFFLFNRMLSQFHFFLQKAWTRKGAAILSLFPVICYGVMAGMSPSTQRAVIMVCVFLLTFLIQRDHDLINTVSIAALIILIFHPPSLFSVAFQLSFAAVLSIILGLSRISRGVARQKEGIHYLIKTAVTFMMVSGLAIIGTTPLTLFYFNQFSVMGIFSNLIFVPLIGFVVVPLALFSVMVLMPLYSPAAVWGLKLSGIILKTSIDGIYLIAGLPYAAVKTITPSVPEMILAYALIAIVIYLLFPSGETRENQKQAPADSKEIGGYPSTDFSMSEGRNPRINHPKPKQRLWPYPLVDMMKQVVSGRNRGIMFLIIITGLLTADIMYWIHKRWWKDDLTVTVMDVGQGNAALLELPNGYCALIDGGGYTDNALFDVGEKIIAPFLWRKKIRTIDAVWLTHYDADHLNGIVYILNQFNVRQVFASHDPDTCEGNEEFIDAVCRQRIRYPAYADFPKKMEINGVTITIVYPQENFSDPDRDTKRRNSNNNSMVIAVTFGQHSVLFPGDIMKAAEKEIVDSTINLQAAVLISPHHGSDTSSSAEFLKRVQPKSVIISSGRQNRFGFPSPKVIDRYAAMKIKTFRTDIHGAVSITSDGERLILAPTLTPTGEKNRR